MAEDGGRSGARVDPSLTRQVPRFRSTGRIKSYLKVIKVYVSSVLRYFKCFKRFKRLKGAERFITINALLRRFKCERRLKGTLDVGNGVGPFGKFSGEQILVACSSHEVTHKGLEKDCFPERENIHNTQFLLPPSEHRPRCFDTEV